LQTIQDHEALTGAEALSTAERRLIVACPAGIV